MLFEIPADIGSKTTPRLLGYLFNHSLFGLLSMQVYIFYLSFPNDPMRNKALVYTLYILEVIQTIVATISAYRVFSSGYGDYSNFDSVGLAWLDVTIISGIVALIAQLFYAYRIRILSRSVWVAGVIMMLSVVQFAGSIAAAVVLRNSLFFSRLLGTQFSITAALWNGGSALCDVIIAVCMTYYLSNRRSEGIESTKITINRVIRLVIETGTLTAMIAIINLILLVLPSKTLWFQLPSLLLCKVYSNSLMAVLNSRMTTSSGYSSERAGPANTFRTKDVNSRRIHTDFELGEGITVTREEYVYPADVRGKDIPQRPSQEQKKTYLV